MRPILASFITLLLFACGDSADTMSNDTIANANNTAPAAFPKNWVSLNYVTCMDTSCPCECWHETYDASADHSDAVTMILLDSLNGKLFANIYTYNVDCFRWELTPTANATFEVRNEKHEIVGELTFNVDTLRLVKNGLTTYFISFPEFEWYEGSEFIGRINANLLQNSINPSDTLIRSLLAVDSATLTCSPEMGNLIYVPGFTHDKWILVPHEDNLWLYEYLGDGNKKQEIPKADTICVGKFPRN